MSETAQTVIESPEVAAARAEYERLADECRRFDPDTITLTRQWNAELNARVALRRKQRQELIDRKGFAFNAWKAAEAGQADLLAKLQKELDEKTAAQEAAYHAFRDAEAEIAAIRARLAGAPAAAVAAPAVVEPVAIAPVAPAATAPVEPLEAEHAPAETADNQPPADEPADEESDDLEDDDATDETEPPAKPKHPAKPAKPTAGKKK